MGWTVRDSNLSGGKKFFFLHTRTGLPWGPLCLLYKEYYQLCVEKDIVKFCKLSRLRWTGRVIRQDDDDLSRRVLLSEPGGKGPRGRPRLRWEDGVKEDAAKLGCRNWTIVALSGAN